MLAPVDIDALKGRLDIFLSQASYDYVIGTAYGYRLDNPFIGYMFMDALEPKYLSQKELLNLVKNINSLLNGKQC